MGSCSVVSSFGFSLSLQVCLLSRIPVYCCLLSSIRCLHFYAALAFAQSSDTSILFKKKMLVYLFHKC